MMLARSAALSLLLAAAALAQDVEKHPYDVARDAIRQSIEAKRKEFAGNPDMLVLDSLVADRKQRRVELLGCATGIAPTDALEFFVAAHSSGKDYESLALTWAMPSDVHKALEFIGLKPGRPINFETNHHWTRGPRVSMTFNWEEKTIAAEELVIDTETKSPIPATGMVFTGSFRHTDDDGKTWYAADVVDSKAIAPNYNDPVAVLDMPGRLSQANVYGFQRPNPKFTFKQGQPLTITLQPAKDAVTSRDLKIVAFIDNGKLRYAVRENGALLASSDNLPQLVSEIAKLVDGKTDLFTSSDIGETTRVEDARKMYAVLMSMEQDHGVKLDPPASGQLFHRAFFPNDAWRNREERLGEPWELFLERADGKLTARLERYVERFGPDVDNKHELQKWGPKSPGEFAEVVNKNESQWTKAIFVYPPADLTYGELMHWVRPVLETYPRVFVFSASGATTQPTTVPAQEP